jgi:hypothetical protein
MRLAFEIILAIPALLFVAALWTGCRQQRRLREGKLFEPRIEHGFLRISNLRFQISNSQRRVSSVANPPVPERLSESAFEAALIAVEQARARGDHAAAEQMLASLHGQAPPSEISNFKFQISNSAAAADTGGAP